MKSLKKSGFTLVEALAGLVVIAAISTCSYYAVTTLVRTGEITRGRNTGVNLLQKSQEEVRLYSRSNFNNLENCKFLPLQSPCGFANITTSYPGYTRTLTITRPAGSAELKQATVKIDWTDFGVAKSLSSTALIARPPQELPGNIAGIVKIGGSGPKAGDLLDGVKISVSSVGTTEQLSDAVLNAENNSNYDFAASNTPFKLDPGQYSLIAEKEGYYRYTYPTSIEVFSDLETRPNEIIMEPKLNDAILRVHLKDATTGAPLSSYAHPDSSVSLYTDGRVLIPNQSRNINPTFKIPFTATDSEKRFTVFTSGAYVSGYAYKTDSRGGESCQFAYQPHGWSSSMVDEMKQLTCQRYIGTLASDRIVMVPGEERDLDIELYPLPRVMIRGRVVTSAGTPVGGATITATWPTGYVWKETGATSAVDPIDGTFSMSVPAVQGMFALGSNLKIIANGPVPTLGNCCAALVNRDSDPVFVGALFPNIGERDIGDVTIKIPLGECGNAQGRVHDASGVILGAQVKIHRNTTTTDNREPINYTYSCQNETLFRLPTGASTFTATVTGYFNYTSDGNEVYASRTDKVNIRRAAMIRYDAELYRYGVADIIVRVKDENTQAIIPNVTVRLTAYKSNPVGSTGATGKEVLFRGVMETWPPIGVDGIQGNSNYNQNETLHKAEVILPQGSLYKPTPPISFTHKRGLEATVVEFSLPSPGAI